MNIFKKYIALFTITTLLFAQSAPAIVNAEEPTPAPTAAVEVTQAPSEVTTTPAPTETPVVTTVTPTPTLTEEEQERVDLLERRARSAAAKEAELLKFEQGTENREQSETSAFQTGTDPVNSTGAVGADTTIKTGNVDSVGNILNTGNTNAAESANISGQPTGAQVTNSGNGSNSANSGAIIQDNNSATIQENNANLNNVLTQGAVTGLNNNSKNTGGDSSIKTGDANVTGTIVNAVNTNAAGVMVSEFNIVDDHYGDLVIDFAAGCIYGCGNGATSAANTGNGSYSDNTAAVFETNNNETTQINNALIGNELNLSADTGNNTASKNTGGNSNIETGDANVVGNVLNFANTNVAGNAVIAFVNIFGQLIGDIILTEDAINNCCGSTNTTVANTGNGSNSTNNAAYDFENNNSTFQTNDADLDNTLNLNAQTGNNSASNNTGANSTIETGNVTVDANVINVVNTNLLGGNMWLAIINEAGNWVGKIMGAPEGTKFAASAGTDYSIDENGYVTATNNGNGAGSDNTAAVSQTNNNTTTQENNAQIGNTLNLSANTGGNAANDNTGGNANIKTGDATIVANLINFVNTNIAGPSKFTVLIINPIGDWVGNLWTPDHKKEQTPENQPAAQANNNNAVGGASESNNANSNNNNSSNNNSSDNDNDQDSSVDVKVEGEGTVAYTQPIFKPFQKSIQGETVTKVNGETKVAGIHAEAPSQILTKNDGKVKVNLAYLAILLPLAVAVLFGRKLVLNRLLAKKN